MSNRTDRYDWTPDRISLLGTAPDQQVAEKLGIAQFLVGYKRRALGIPAYQQQSRSKSILVDDELQGKIEQLAPLLAEQFRARGLPVSTLEPWQVIEVAVNELYQRAKREKVKQSYAIEHRADKT